MNSLSLSRRNLLKGASFCAAARALLPELTNPAYAAGLVPKVFLMFYSYHGTWKEQWGSGANGMTLGPLLQPLADFKNDIVLVSGLNMRSAQLYPGDNFAGHIQGQVHSLTSMKPLRPVDSVGSRPVAGGPSIDQEILELCKAQNGGQPLTAIDSLQLGIANSPPGPDQMMGRAGYKRASGSIRPMGFYTDPKLAYAQVFNGFTPGPLPPTPQKEDPVRRKRRLMAGFSKGQFNSTSATIRGLYGKESQDRFTAHADYMASFEQSLAPVPAGGPGPGSPVCELPSADSFSSRPAFDWADTLADNMPKLAHLAIACGRTRFVTVNIEATVTADSNLHSNIHAGNVPGTRAYHVKIAELVATTLRKLKDTPTSDGKNLLYHTTFLWAGELGNGMNHSYDDLQWVVGGQAGGDLQTGRYVNANGRSNADLFVSLGKLMGSGMTTFGDPLCVTGAMPEIKA